MTLALQLPTMHTSTLDGDPVDQIHFLDPLFQCPEHAGQLPRLPRHQHDFGAFRDDLGRVLGLVEQQLLDDLRVVRNGKDSLHGRFFVHEPEIQHGRQAQVLLRHSEADFEGHVQRLLGAHERRGDPEVVGRRMARVAIVSELLLEIARNDDLERKFEERVGAQEGELGVEHENLGQSRRQVDLDLHGVAASVLDEDFLAVDLVHQQNLEVEDRLAQSKRSLDALSAQPQERVLAVQVVFEAELQRRLPGLDFLPEILNTQLERRVAAHLEKVVELEVLAQEITALPELLALLLLLLETILLVLPDRVEGPAPGLARVALTCELLFGWRGLLLLVLG